MTEALLERRRSPRVMVGPGVGMGVALPLAVRVMDISASGVLLSSPQRMHVGQRARLQLTLDGAPLNVEVEVKRVVEGQEAGGRSRYRLGARFVAPDQAARHCVEHFLRTDDM